MTPEELKRIQTQSENNLKRNARFLLRAPKNHCLSNHKVICRFPNKRESTAQQVTQFLKRKRRSYEPCSGSCFSRTRIRPATNRGEVGATVIRLEQVNRSLNRGHS